jgi:hypothetical protein
MEVVHTTVYNMLRLYIWEYREISIFERDLDVAEGLFIPIFLLWLGHPEEFVDVHLLLGDDTGNRTHDLGVVIIGINLVKYVVDDCSKRDEVLKLDCSLDGSDEIEIVVHYHCLRIELDLPESLLSYLVISYKWVHDRARTHIVIDNSVSKWLLYSQRIIQTDVTNTLSAENFLRLKEWVCSHVLKRIKDQEV